MDKVVLAIHGGAGTILRSQMTPEKESSYTNALDQALMIGYRMLETGSSAIDAVQAAVIALENCPLFNAGKGSVFTHDGNHEMDASIMDGSDLKAGAVACVSLVKNPIVLARTVMEHSDHVFLMGNGAEEFARSRGIVFETKEYFYDQYRHDQLTESRKVGTISLDHSDKKFGTVGAVALDSQGNLAAATSTGGMTNKQFNRIGDSPIIGAGTYANNRTCAVSCTGHGEFFLRSVVAYDVSCLMEYKGYNLHDACNHVVMKKLVDLGGEGGLIAVDSNGQHAMPFNSEGMYRGVISKTGKSVQIYK